MNRSTLRSALGVLLLLIGVSVFLVRFNQAGPYHLPAGGNLAGGVLALLLGAWFVRPWLGDPSAAKPLGWLALLATPVALYLALYATLAELEEVVVLKAEDRSGAPANLRLWIVDRDDGAWVTMRRSKADEHGLTDARVELLRNGQVGCVVAERDEGRDRAVQIHAMRDEKYAVQRFAKAIGAFPSEPSEDTVAVRLTPCPAQ